MSLFPTRHERFITITIITFCVGLGIGLIVHPRINDNLIPLAGTIAAAFLGAWTAFFLESKSRHREIRQKNLDAANSLIYALFERSSVTNFVKTKLLDPKKDDPLRFLSIEPIRDFRSPESKILVQDISYIFQTKYRYLVLELHVIDQRFEALTKLIKRRSDLHLNEVQVKLDAAGLKEKDMVTLERLEEIVGNKTFVNLQKNTDHLIEMTDRFVEDIDAIQQKLIQAFFDLFSNHEVFDVKTLSEKKTLK